MTALRVRDYSEHTVNNRYVAHRLLSGVGAERGLTETDRDHAPGARTLSAAPVSLPQEDGEPMSFRSQHARLVALRVGSAG